VQFLTAAELQAGSLAQMVRTHSVKIQLFQFALFVGLKSVPSVIPSKSQMLSRMSTATEAFLPQARL